jgi:ketosteroid isomerase-like protein
LVLILAVAVAFATTPASGQQTPNEQAVWKLESNYWEYVQALDLDRYRDLWHANFVGWPSVSSQPARKDHITDWIDLRTAKGARMKWFSLQPAASQATENVVVTHYWLTSLWADKAGHGEPSTMRVTHTWIKTAEGWKIIGGMSAPVPTD